MKRVLSIAAVPVLFLTMGCGEGAASERASGPLEHSQATPQLGATKFESGGEVPADEGSHEGRPDVCLIAKPWTMDAQCIVASLREFEIDSRPHEGSLGIMACRPVKEATLESRAFLGDYVARAGAFTGGRFDMARVTLETAESGIFDASREGTVGRVSIFDIDPSVHGIVRGEVVVETAEGSGVFLKRQFDAFFLGHFLNMPYIPSPDREWDLSGGVP